MCIPGKRHRALGENLTMTKNRFDIDPEIQAFIEKTRSYYEDQCLDDMVSQRACYNAMCRAFDSPYPEGVTSTSHSIDSNGHDLPLRQYRSPSSTHQTAIVYFHGGGFVVGDLESHDSICADICNCTGLTVFAVEYRLAPEYHFPDDLDDALAGFHYVARKFNQIIVVGDSAGGTLAAAVGIATRNLEFQPSGQVLIYPSLGGEDLGLASYLVNAHAPLLTTEDVHYYRNMRTTSGNERNNPLLFPLKLVDYQGLPRCVVFSADIDPLRDDARVFTENTKKAGVASTWINEPGLPHGYLRARHCSQLAGNGFSRICRAITEIASTTQG